MEVESENENESDSNGSENVDVDESENVSENESKSESERNESENWVEVEEVVSSKKNGNGNVVHDENDFRSSPSSTTKEFQQHYRKHLASFYLVLLPVQIDFVVVVAVAKGTSNSVVLEPNSSLLPSSRSKVIHILEQVVYQHHRSTMRKKKK